MLFTSIEHSENFEENLGKSFLQNEINIIKLVHIIYVQCKLQKS